MRKRAMQILKWLEENPGWHSIREIGIESLGLDKTRRWGNEAIIGHLKKLRMVGKVEFGKGKQPGVLESYRAKEE